MAKTVIISEFGNSSVMKLVDREVSEPKTGEIKIKHKACGLNYIDVYQRTGLYPLNLPTALGMEASGVVEAVGEGIHHLKEGDRVAYASNPPGAYCESRTMSADQVCLLPDSISFEEGAAMMLKGLTVQYLFHRTVSLKKGDTVLFHAAAGGVGLIACQWARSEGINLIGTAGSDQKCELAEEYGAKIVIRLGIAATDLLEDVRPFDFYPFGVALPIQTARIMLSKNPEVTPLQIVWVEDQLIPEAYADDRFGRVNRLCPQEYQYWFGKLANIHCSVLMTGCFGVNVRNDLSHFSATSELFSPLPQI